MHNGESAEAGFCILEEKYMNKIQAYSLQSNIQREHPELLSAVRTLDGDEHIIVLRRLQARKWENYFHIWNPLDWYLYQDTELRSTA